MGSRLNSGNCVDCGTPLIYPYNDYQCCSSCTAKIEAIVKKTKGNKPKPKFLKPMQYKIIDRRNVLRQLRPRVEFDE